MIYFGKIYSGRNLCGVRQLVATDLFSLRRATARATIARRRDLRPSHFNTDRSFSSYILHSEIHDRTFCCFLLFLLRLCSRRLEQIFHIFFWDLALLGLGLLLFVRTTVCDMIFTTTVSTASTIDIDSVVVLWTVKRQVPLFLTDKARRKGQFDVPPVSSFQNGTNCQGMLSRPALETDIDR